MSGQATRMFDAFEFIAEHSQAPTAIRSAAERAIEDIGPATLEAMDAAAEVLSWESGRVKIDEAITSLAPAAIVDVGGQLLWLVPKDEQSLLAVLLRREVQRRKEQGHG